VRIAVVGAGRVGTAVAVLLARRGHEVVAVSGRSETEARVRSWLPGVPFVPAPEAAALGEVVFLAVPDDALGTIVSVLGAAGTVASGAWAVHLSGAAGLDVLTPLTRGGARRLAIHPLQTFPRVEAAIEALPGCRIAVTADDEEGVEVGERLARDVGGVPFRLRDERRALYHAAAVFASNYLVATSAVAERLFAIAGVPDPLGAMAPLQEATLTNVTKLGPEAALTGPAVRGDATTVERNLSALADDAPETVAAYVAMCRVALDVAVRSGRLDPPGVAAVEAVLERWDR